MSYAPQIAGKNYAQFIVNTTTNETADEVVEALARRGILGGVPLSRLLPAWPEAQSLLLLAATELNTDAEMNALAIALTEALQ